LGVVEVVDNPAPPTGAAFQGAIGVDGVVLPRGFLPLGEVLQAVWVRAGKSFEPTVVGDVFQFGVLIIHRAAPGLAEGGGQPKHDRMPVGAEPNSSMLVP